MDEMHHWARALQQWVTLALANEVEVVGRAEAEEDQRLDWSKVGSPWQPRVARPLGWEAEGLDRSRQPFLLRAASSRPLWG